jgi:uncharacterized repeat protein (TIGR03847 family)
VSAGESFEFDRVDAFVPGALGEPGQRVFYLQARAGERVVSLRCEKQQVGMLGRYLTQLAEAIGPTEPDRDIVGLIEPVTEQWTVGQLSVGVDEANGKIMVTADELTADSFEVDDEDADPGLLAQLLEAVEDTDEEPAAASFVLSAPQALAFGERAEELMSSGRPACRLCGAPMDPEGHDCPRWN